MNLLAKAHSYASRKNAVRKLQQVFADKLDDYRWLVIAQADGRYTPAVVMEHGTYFPIAAVAQAGVAVIG